MAIQRSPRPAPTWFDWLESNFPFRSPFASDEHPIRVEEYLDGDDYTIRAEIPGVDPDRDLEISVEHGKLTLAAERVEEFKEGKRSEFHYGFLTRTVDLPEGSAEDAIAANYVDGVLTVTVPVRTRGATRRKVAISKEPRPEQGLPGVSTPEPSPGLHGVSDPQEQRAEDDVMRTEDPPE